MSGLLASLQHLVPAAGDGVHVLAYHLVGGGTASPVDLPADDFRRQMEELAAGGRVVSLDAALARLAGEAEAGGGTTGGGTAVVLTFDDAYRNFATAAWPLLRDLALPATLYVPTAFVDGVGRSPISVCDLPAASWDELARLAGEGLTLGSHSHAHRDLPALSAAEVADDLARARRLLAERTGSAGEHFCYPRALRSRRAERVVARFHVSAAIAGGNVNRRRRFSPLRLSRLPVRRDLGASAAPLLAHAVHLHEWLASRARRPRAWLRRTLGGPLRRRSDR